MRHIAMGSSWQRVRRSAAVALTFLCMSCSGGSGGGAAASCVGPYLDDQPPSGVFGAPIPTVAPGARLIVYGHWYTSTCNDTGGQHDPLVPLPPVRLTLTLPGGSAVDLGRFSPAGDDMGFSTAVQVPADSAAGVAVVRDDRGYGAPYTFQVGR